MGKVGPGEAWYGGVWKGKARFGSVGRGRVRLGLVRLGKVWSGKGYSERKPDGIITILSGFFIMREKAQSLLKQRQLAYQQLFLGHGTATDTVLKDLARFCRAHESTFHAEHSVSDRLDGRREVFLRIAHFLHLTDEQLWMLYGNNSLIESQPEE